MNLARQQLSSLIIREHFGDECETIFNIISKHEKITHKLLIKSLNNMDKYLIQKHLKTLIHQHCVTKYKPSIVLNLTNTINDSNNDIIWYYEVDIDSCELRLHFGKYLQIIMDKLEQFKYYCGDIVFRYFVNNGRVSKIKCYKSFLNDILVYIENMKKDKYISVNGSDSDNNIKHKTQFEKDKNLWIHELSGKNDKNVVNREISKHFNNIWDFFVKESFIIEFQEELEESKDDAKINDDNDVDMDMDMNMNGNNNSNNIHNKISQYIICHRRFLHEMRQEIIMDYVFKKFNDNFTQIAKIVMDEGFRIFLNQNKHTLSSPHKWLSNDIQIKKNNMYIRHPRPLNRCTISSISNRFGINKIRNSMETLADQDKQLIEVPISYNTIKNNLKVKVENLSECISILSDGNEITNLHDITPVLMKDYSSDNEYYVNISGIIDKIRMMDIQQIVHAKCHNYVQLTDDIKTNNNNNNNNNNSKTVKSVDHVQRVFRSIIELRMVGEEQISQTCLLETSDVRKILSQLLKERFIEIQEVPNTIDRAPNQTFYCYHIPWYSVHKRILHSMYKALINLILKKMDFKKKLNKLISNNNNNNKTINTHSKYSIAIQKLTFAIQKLNNQIAIHRDY